MGTLMKGMVKRVQRYGGGSERHTGIDPNAKKKKESSVWGRAARLTNRAGAVRSPLGGGE